MTAGMFGEGIVGHGDWRRGLVDAILRYSRWLDTADLPELSARLQPRLAGLAASLREDRISVACVAEFSRGKSELINALFFSGYGQRVLPSSAGRTTMCPTELLYDASRPPSIRLLPIESRLRDASLFELRQDVAAWHEIPIRAGDRQSIAEAFENVRQTRGVTCDEAAALGMAEQAGSDGLVQIPRWRHAIVNFPDPLLETGLVVIDTPGLNAIGVEPELTLDVIPHCDAVLFLLAADTGVTRSDIDVWRTHIAPNQGAGRFVVLNKIDGLWDDLRDDAQADAEIDAQVRSVAETLSIPAGRVYPVSAQKGLVARIRRDSALLRRSRLPVLERALSSDLLPRRRALLSERVGRDFDHIHGAVASVLSGRRGDTLAQLSELVDLRGRNRGMVEQLATRVEAERARLDRGLRHLHALRSVSARHSATLHRMIGLEGLRKHVREAREAMRASQFSMGLRDGMDRLMQAARADFDAASRVVDEVAALMAAMYRTFESEHGLRLGAPAVFSTVRHVEELGRIEALHRSRFGAMSLVTTEKWALMRRFFESVAAGIREVYAAANRELEAWLRALLTPIEGQLAERQSQLQRRIDSMRRILEVGDSLDARISEVDQALAQAGHDLARCAAAASEVEALLGRSTDPAAATTAGRDGAGHAAPESASALSRTMTGVAGLST